MKKTWIALATLIVIPSAMAGFGPGGMGGGPGGMGGGPGGMGGGPGGMGGGPGMRGGPNVEYMARVLDLTPEQQEKVKTLFTDHAKKRDETRAAMQADMQSKMQGILTKEQFTKMTDLRQFGQGGQGGRGQGMGPGTGQGAGTGGCPRMWAR